MRYLLKNLYVRLLPLSSLNLTVCTHKMFAKIGIKFATRLYRESKRRTSADARELRAPRLQRSERWAGAR